MRPARLAWALGVAVLVLAIPSAYFVARVLPFSYDFRAYWLAAFLGPSRTRSRSHAGSGARWPTLTGSLPACATQRTSS